MNADLISRHSGAERLGRHWHVDGYAALVLAGGYVEAGDGPRFRVEPGQVIVHEAYDAHQDAFAARGAVVINLPVVPGLSAGIGSVEDPDGIVRLAERDRSAAAELLASSLRLGGERLDDWPDRVAAALSADAAVDLGYLADELAIHPASLSRGFLRCYGVTPKRYRLEQRARRALHGLPSWRGSLASLAAEMGFADQAHLTRAVRALTGLSPARWRAKSVQSGARLPR